MKLLIALMLTVFCTSAFALNYQTTQVSHVYGSGWEVDGGWLVPMSETSADAILQLENAGKTKATCQVKGITKGATTDPNTLEFLAYDINSCN